MSKKVLLIGLDGFSPFVFKDLCDEGVMPYLESLCNTGTSGILKSVVPFETSPAWSSLQTGSRPEKTSIYTFHRYESDRRKIRLNSFRDIAVPSIWELLSDSGKRVININMPVTSPPPKVNGIMIPGLLCPELNSENVYPSEIYEKYISKIDGYKIVDKRWDGNIDLFVQRACDVIKARGKLTAEIISNEPYDLASVQFQMTDVLQHNLWWSIDKTHPKFDKKTFTKISQIYRQCDNEIKKLCELAGKDVLKIVVSDHGFCKQTKTISVNTWLNRKGYLKLIANETTPNNPTIDSLKKRVAFVKSMAKIYGKIKKKLKNISKEQDTRLFCIRHLEHLRKLIDLNQPNIFCLGAMGCFFYATDDFDKNLLSEIKDSLSAEFGPDSEEKLIKSIEILPEAIGDEPVMKIELEEGVLNAVTPAQYGHMPIISSPPADGLTGGTHSINGFWLASGKDIKQQNLDAEIVDIMLTILAYMDIAIPEHVDGKVAKEIFLENIDIKYYNSEIEKKDKSDYSDDEQSGVEDQLHNLGYI